MTNESYRLLIITTILICVGIAMVYSSSSLYAYDMYGDSAYYLKRHIAHFLVGLVIAAFIMRFNYKNIKKHAKLLLAISILGLILVHIPGIGREAGGAKRWIKLGAIGFQPSEFAGLFLIFYLADILDRKEALIKNLLYGFLPPLAISGFVVLLILSQPDLGSAVVLFVIAITMMFTAGANMVYLLPFVFLAMPLFYFLILKVPYRLKRILGYIDPWSDAQGSGFQIVQSFLALGCGGIFGVGLGASRQKLFYLPQAHTDFIFSIIGEELGIIGTMAIVILFSLFIWYGLQIAMKASDAFGRFLAMGVTVSIGLRAIVNIAVSTGAIPTKGLPLPFISYGGTSLIINMVGVGFLMRIAER